MRNHAKDGAYNETSILNALNKHYFKDLSANWKRHMERMFKDIKDNDYITCTYHLDKLGKPDIDIIVNKRKVLLSIKSGNHPSMHSEPLRTFFEFLRSFDVPERIISIIAFYHYGYSLKKRIADSPLTREEIISKYSKYIKEVNNYFAEHQELVREMIYRSIIRGRLKGDLIDYFYYGNVAKGLLFSTYDVINLIMNDKNRECQSICFNALVYGPCSRVGSKEKRHKMKISWPILSHYYYDDSFIKKFG